MRSPLTSLALSLSALATLAVAPPLASQAGQTSAAPAATQSPAPKLDDPTIIAIFDAANTADIETGALAARRAHSPDVRKLGAMFAHDHRQVRQQGRDLAAKLHVRPTPPADRSSAREHAAVMRRLRALHGAAFDRAFLEHEVAYHKAVIDAVTTTLLPAIQNAELKALVERVAPAFQAHMAAAERLRTQVARK